MSLHDVVASVEAREKTLSLLNPRDADLAGALAEYLADLNVAVAVARTDTGEPRDVAVLTRGDELLASTECAALAGLVDETAPGPDGLGVDDAAADAVLSHLKETTFTAYDRAEMTAVSREIEDRAWRVGSGTLLAGFQTTSVLAGEAETYRNLATEGLDVHAFAAPDGADVDVADVTLHVEDVPEIRDSWFVVFDGGGVRGQECALLAEARGENAYYGFWTYDPSVVERIYDHLAATYEHVSV
jgi:hypothetical protein